MAKASAAKRGGKRPRTPGGTTGSRGSRALVDSMRAVLFEGIGVGAHDDVAAIDRAQDLVYEAWEAPTAKKRRELAEEALRISGDCADAYNILADLASDPAEERDLYEKAVGAGARALGEDFFEENVGHFWGLLETRPYMRARAGLAELLWDAGEREAAVDHYREMLRLNPGDNQGIRQILVGRLLEIGRDADAAALLKAYKDDGSVWMVYARALAAFRTEGDSAAARKRLVAARKANGHVPDYLLSRKKLPRSTPDYHGFGDDSEAVCFMADGAAAWHATSGAVAWLATTA
jgi:tetratricopeptide (TPR) repeat protein